MLIARERRNLPVYEETMRLAHQSHEDFLSNILSQRGRPTHLQRKPINASLKPPVQLGQGRFISSQH